LKNKVLKKKVKALSNELNDLINKNENLEKQINSLNNKNMFLEKEIIELEIKSQDSLQKRKVNDVETSSLNTQDSNIFYHI
jgi:predicted  nucleic acid-binding Zn-ribbon protein